MAYYWSVPGKNAPITPFIICTINHTNVIHYAQANHAPSKIHNVHLRHHPDRGLLLNSLRQECTKYTTVPWYHAKISFAPSSCNYQSWQALSTKKIHLCRHPDRGLLLSSPRQPPVLYKFQPRRLTLCTAQLSDTRVLNTTQSWKALHFPVFWPEVFAIFGSGWHIGDGVDPNSELGFPTNRIL